MFPDLWTIPLFDYQVRGYGFMFMIGVVSATYLATKRAEKVRANPDVVLSCAFFCDHRRPARRTSFLCGPLLGAALRER